MILVDENIPRNPTQQFEKFSCIENMKQDNERETK
jgi:hypothetical protein